MAGTCLLLGSTSPEPESFSSLCMNFSIRIIHGPIFICVFPFVFSHLILSLAVLIDAGHRILPRAEV